MHLHSPEFREEFFALVRNDEVYIRLYSLHLFLMAEKLKQVSVPLSLTNRKGFSSFLSHKQALYRLQALRLPTHFYQSSYQHFHAHLPEELFYTDFTTFFKKANS